MRGGITVSLILQQKGNHPLWRNTKRQHTPELPAP